MNRHHILSAPFKFFLLFTLALLLATLMQTASTVHGQTPPPSIQGPIIKIVQAPPSPNPVQIPRNVSINAPQVATITVTYVNAGGCPAATDAWTDVPVGETDSLQVAFERAVSTWEATLTSAVEIRVEATLEDLPGSTLGFMGFSATRDFTNAPINSVWFARALADKHAGGDLHVGSFDITGSIDCATDWHTDAGPTDPAQFDLETVSLHELGHGLGFAGGGDVAGASGSIRVSGFPFVYDCFTGTANPSGRYLLNTADFPDPGTELATALQNGGNTSNGFAPGVFFYGNQAVTANGGAVPLYAPAVWESGSSYSHVDSTTYNGTAEDLMTPSIGPGDMSRAVGPVTVAMFGDLSWSGVFNGEACSTPTAINLQSTGASTTLPTPIIALGLIAILGTGIIVYRRRDQVG